MKPTGRIVLRDLGDIYLSRELVEALGNEELVKSWPKENLLSGKVSASVGIMHGNQLPSWLTEEQYSAWAKDYFRVYDEEFSRLTGIPTADLAGSYIQNGRYFLRNLNFETEATLAYLKRVEKLAVPVLAHVDPYALVAPEDRPPVNRFWLRGLASCGPLFSMFP